MVTEQVLATLDGAAAPTLGSFIGGRAELRGGPTFPVRDPATGALLGHRGGGGRRRRGRRRGRRQGRLRRAGAGPRPATAPH